MPTPLSDPEASWLWHNIMVLGPAVSATDDGGDISRNYRAEIDTKAMRKVQIGNELAFVWEGQILAGSPTFDGHAAARLMALLT